MLRHLKYYILRFRFFNLVILLKTSILRTYISAYQKKKTYLFVVCYVSHPTVLKISFKHFQKTTNCIHKKNFYQLTVLEKSFLNEYVL